MSNLDLDLGNANNWEQIHHSSRTVNYTVGTTQYQPLPDISVSPTTLDSPILAVHASSSKSKPNWKSAGWLTQRIRLGILVGGRADADAPSNRRVLLNRVVLILWPRFTSHYELTFSAHYWLEQLDLSCWKYTGPYVDPLAEKIDLTRVDILRTEQKVNFLLDRSNY